jgi:hypothetical protein
MSQPKYDPIELSRDATAFAKSRFGQHYLARLEDAQKRHLEAAMNIDFTDSYRSHRASKAAAIASEIEYFKIAQTIQETPSLMERLRKKLMGKEDADDPDV